MIPLEVEIIIGRSHLCAYIDWHAVVNAVNKDASINTVDLFRNIRNNRKILILIRILTNAINSRFAFIHNRCFEYLLKSYTYGKSIKIARGLFATHKSRAILKFACHPVYKKAIYINDRPQHWIKYRKF